MHVFAWLFISGQILDLLQLFYGCQPLHAQINLMPHSTLRAAYTSLRGRRAQPKGHLSRHYRSQKSKNQVQRCRSLEWRRANLFRRPYHSHSPFQMPSENARLLSQRRLMPCRRGQVILVLELRTLES